MVEREGVGFLLIADLHMGHPDSKLTWPQYRDELERDLRREHDQTGPWDVVIVAGGLYHRRDAGTEQIFAGLLETLRRMGSDPAVFEAADAVQVADVRVQVAPGAVTFDVAATRHTVPVRSLLGDERRGYGYVSGRIGPTAIDVRPRAFWRNPTAHGFGEDAAYPATTLPRHAVARESSQDTRVGPTPVPETFVRSTGRWGPFAGEQLRTPQWSPDGTSLSVAAVVDGAPVTRWISPSSAVSEVRVAAAVRAMPAPAIGTLGVVTADDDAVMLTDVATQTRTLLLGSARAQSIAWVVDQRRVAIAVEGDLVVVDPSGTLVRTLSLHDDPCLGITATADGRVLASISALGEIKLWRTSDWTPLAQWHWGGRSATPECIAFCPAAWTLAVCEPDNVELFSVDPAILGARAVTQPTSVTAKVVLVGQGRVGKTCLAQRLVHDRYTEQAPTHGMRLWSLPIASDDAIAREVMLWDLGGQSEYRLLHQLFLPDTELALVLVDPATEAYDDVREWVQRLDNAGPIRKVLVATKVDADHSPVDHAALARIAVQCGMVQTVLTSAQTRRGRDELLAAIAQHVAWDALAQDTRGAAGQWLHTHLDTLRRAGRVVVSVAEIEPALPPSIDAADLIGAIRQLARRGTIANTRTATGEQVLVLRIDEIERYAGSLIVAAQQQVSGVPALDAGALLGARMAFPRIAAGERLPRAEECVVLDCVLEMLLQQGLALLHHGQLVFPSLFETGGDPATPPLATPPPAKVHFEFGGAVDNAYASLVTDLALANAYGVPRMARGSARFSRAGVGTCGVRRVQAGGARRAGLEVFFEDDTEEATERAFVCFVDEHLRRAGLEMVEHNEMVCHQCAYPFESSVIDKRLDADKNDVVCQICEARTRIVLRSDQARRRDASIDARTQGQREAARAGRSRSAASGKRLIEGGANVGTPRWVLVLSDLHVAADSDIDTMRQTLLEDLTSRAGPRPERFAALVVCGDVTNRATLPEFERAHALIGSLVDELPGITAANTIIVPGNHDVDWAHPGVYQFHAGPRPPGLTDAQYIEHGPLKVVRHEAAYRESFRNFSSALYETFYQRPYPRDPAQQVDLFDVPHAGLTFVTLNSAWNTAQYSPHAAEIRDAAIGLALQRLGQVPANRLKIAVWHHPITGNEKIRADAFVQRLRGGGIRLCLHGHVHESRADLLGYLHPHKIHAIGTGSFGAPAHERAESTPRLYHLLQIADDRASLRVHTRQLARSGGAWEPFYEWPHPDDPGQRLPHYDVLLRP